MLPRTTLSSQQVISHLKRGQGVTIVSLRFKSSSAVAYDSDLDNLIWQDNAALGLSPAQGRNRTEAMTRWVLSYDLIFHALVAWTLCCLPESQDSSTSIGQQLLCHRACTLRMLHERLSNGVVDDVLIQGIGLLIPIDDHLGYTEFNQAHLNGIERIIERRGGFAAVGSSEPALGLHLAALVSISTTKLSINTASSAGHMHITSFADWPAVDPSLASPIYASTPLHLAANVARLPSGFVSLITSGRLSNDMVTILVEFDKWLHSLSQTSPGGPEPMAYRFNVPSGLSSLEKHICTALICLTDDLTTMGTLYAALIFRKPLKRTKALLAELNALWTSYDMTASNKVPSADDVLIWLATIIPTPRRPELTPKNARRALYGRLMSRKPWLSDWANVETILGRFFYSSTRSAAWKESWKDYWDMDKTPSFLT